MRTHTRTRIRAARLALAALLALALGACGGKGPDVFNPVGSSGGGGGFPSIGQISGDWTFGYINTSTDCEPSLAPFQVDATLSSPGGSTLDVDFADAPVPITGPYSSSTGAYDGMTVPVDIGGGFFATESWEGDFSFNLSTMPVYTGTSFVEVVDDMDVFVCERRFNVTGSMAP